MADEEAPKEDKRDPDDILKDWFKARAVSSFKCKPEAADALVNNEASRVAVETFLNNETSQRLLVFSNPDLMAVRADPMRLSEATRVTIAASRERLPSSSVHAVGSDPFTIATATFFGFRDASAAPVSSSAARPKASLTPAQSLPKTRKPTSRTSTACRP